METKVCRTCLATSGLNKIFLNPEDHTRYSTDIYVTAGVKVTPNDGLPQDMCTNCIVFLNKSLQFRQKCRDTETYLLKIKNNLELISFDKDRDVIPMKDTENTHDTDKVIYETKNEDFKVKNGAETFNVNIEIKREYLDDRNWDDDDDRPLKDWRDENKDLSNDSAFIMLQEQNEKIDFKNEESEIIIPTAPTRRISCQFCRKTLSIRSLNEHIAQQHPGADGSRVKCALCDERVVRTRMGHHRKVRHGAGSTFRCGYCKTEYDSEELLITHVPTCTAKKKRPRHDESAKKLEECDICHKTMLKASLRAHIALKHEGKGPVCEHCGRRFANKLRLGEHRRARHGHDKFKCALCDYQSASSLTMKNHERRHRGERPFVCEACGSGFHSLHLLHQHRQSHRTEKLIKCDLCPAMFKANNSVHVHRQTCHSRAAYRCRLCGRTFRCKNYAARHARHVHSLGETGSALERVATEAAVESEQ